MTDGAVDERALRDLERHPVQVLGLGDRRPHDVAQRHRLAPHPRRLLTGEDEQVLGVAAHPRGEVVQAEQLGERVGVALRLLELVDDLQLPVEHALVASGEVHQHVGGEPAAADLRVGQLAGEVVLLVLLVLGDPPEQHHADAGEQHRDAVDERPEPRVGLRRGVVEHQVRSHIEPTPWLTTVNRTFSRNGTQSWYSAMKPMMMKKWKWASMRPAGDAHQGGRAPHEPGGDRGRPEPPVMAQQPAQRRADHGDARARSRAAAAGCRAPGRSRPARARGPAAPIAGGGAGAASRPRSRVLPRGRMSISDFHIVSHHSLRGAACRPGARFRARHRRPESPGSMTDSGSWGSGCPRA